MFIVGQIMKISFGEYMKAYSPGILIGIITAAAIYIVTQILNYFDTILFFKLLSQIIIGAFFLLYFVLIKPLPVMQELMRNRIDKIAFFNNKGRILLKYLRWYNNR